MTTKAIQNTQLMPQKVAAQPGMPLGIPVKMSALATMAARFEMEPQTLLNTLKNTVFKGATNEQLAALVVVANEHKLNPFTREIYAFPDKQGGIQAVVGVDGWIRIITSNPSFDGVEFETDGESCTCRMYVKERSHPVVITEYLAECKRNTQPWQSHPRRMLRHKALIQAGRIAFGFGGLKDEDDVYVHPASATVTSRPIFQALPEPDPQAAAEEPQADAPAEAEVQPEPAEAGTLTTPPAPAESHVNYVKALRGLCKLGGIKESELLDLLHARGLDDSLTSFEEVATVAPDWLRQAYEGWQAILAEIKKLKAAK